MSVLTPICVLCRLEMRCVKNERLVRDPEAACGPSTYWYGDEYQCPVCSLRIVTGFGKPMEHNPEPAGDVLQFDHERPPALRLLLDLRTEAGMDAFSLVFGGPKWEVPLSLPAGVAPGDIVLEESRPIPLLAFGDLRRPIAVLTVSQQEPSTLKGMGRRGEGPDYEGTSILWAAVAAGAVEARPSLTELPLQRGREQWRLWAISLELRTSEATEDAG